MFETFGGDPRRAFFGVYDGHGGSEAAGHAADALHNVSSLRRQFPTPASDSLHSIPIRKRQKFLDTK